MFAEDGVFAVTNRQITEAAGQKNESALNYHFGTRNELIITLLTRRNKDLDAIRQNYWRILAIIQQPRTRPIAC
ncbi:MAG: hypothetical protein CM15mP49_35010 [Actinomycetota bacterium]|nr:MAG: hypothetical protein CM15mP49_35010 [Actinomycetota bacterium]